MLAVYASRATVFSLLLLNLNVAFHGNEYIFFIFFYFFLGCRGTVHPPSADEGTERTWFEPEQRPRKHVPKRSVHGKQSPQGASKMSWRQDDQHYELKGVVYQAPTKALLGGYYSKASEPQ